MTDIDLEEYISGGYIITRPIDSTAHNRWLKDIKGATEDLLPPHFLSIGFCNISHAPIFDWTEPREEDYANYGIPYTLIPELSTWANERYKTEIGFPWIFFHLNTAQEYIRRFAINATDLQILGIGLHREHLQQIRELEQLYPARITDTGAEVGGYAYTGFAQALKLNERPLSGEILEFDVICCEYHIDHSWLCDGFEVEALNTFHFRPNRFGLIDGKLNANRLASYIDALELSLIHI